MSAFYLVTLSRAENVGVKTKQKFGELLKMAFNESFGSECVRYWAAAQEKHKEEGYRYHATIMLDRSYRFSKPQKWLNSRGIHVNFSAGEAKKEVSGLRAITFRLFSVN